MSEDIDRLAQAFMDGFTNGNGEWDNSPEHHRENYREGVRSLLAELRKPKERKVAFKEGNVTYWSDGTASQEVTDYSPFMSNLAQVKGE